MIDIGKNRTLSPLGLAAALSVAMIVVFVACALVELVAPGLRVTHAWVTLFTAVLVTTPQAWLEGVFFSLLFGIVVGSVVAVVHNAIAARGL